MTRDIRGHSHNPRRQLLRSVASLAGLTMVGCATTRPARGAETQHNAPEPQEAEVTPGEDLMQEHGVLERVLLIYDEAARRIDQAEALDVALVGRAADIVRRFIEQYHEQLEEKFVFPRLEKAARERELVAILRRQHELGRHVTADIVRLSGAGNGRSELAQRVRSFVRMYRPHAAREDTILFPVFRSVVGRAAYRELGEQFEAEEHTRFGERGFQDTVFEVAELEQALGTFELDQFTPSNV